ncbi:B3 domain-containing protein Os03g0212300-like [Quercus suber]|uniref:B3 domain-containing protein Os03g0212300-like n=1 Tax=Quercus suber TaxID=58331 RepID=UPI0032DE3537
MGVNRISRKFTRKYGQGLSNFAFLKLLSGVGWNVELTESDGEVWLQKGWPEFAKYYSIKQGHFLVFRYEGNSHFYVLIFDESATEIDYHFNTSHGGKGKLHNEFIAPNMEEIESYSDIEFLGSFPPSPKTRDKSPLPYFRPHKIMKTNSSGVKGISTIKQRLKSKAVRAFTVVEDFVKKYSNILHGDVNLWVSDGSNWPVEFCKRIDDNLLCRFDCRWKAFAKDNNLVVGDVCAFELIEATKTFKVVIFRVCTIGTICENLLLSCGFAETHIGQMSRSQVGSYAESGSERSSQGSTWWERRLKRREDRECE